MLAPLLALAALAGCGKSTPLVAPGELLHYQSVATELEMPNLNACPDDPALATASPETINENGPIQYWDMKLSDAMHIALVRSKVMHDLGGAELRNPDSIRTISDPAIIDTDPRFGVESALSDYDAVFNASVDSQHNHRALNNIFFGGGTRILIQDLDTFKEEIVKETPTGTEFTFRHNTTYDNNNEPGNLFPSAWDTNFEAEVRQHLLQGSGVEYNRIAGPHGSPGQMNGVLIARINTDVALTDFEMGVRDLASNVENAYWDLYFAYRDLDAKVMARDNALESWRRTHALNLANRRGGEAEKEAQVRQQYFQFQEEVENAWNGRLVDGTHTDDGSPAGSFRGGGVRVAERRLRRLLGLPVNDGRLIRPSDEPALAKMVFAWGEILPEALSRRPELRRQRWMIKRRELELIASRNFLLPTLDVTGLYRFRGFGHDLIDTDPNQAQFDSAFGDLGTGMFQEWELGAQFSMPIGDRKGHVAVRNAQLNLARERSILDDQEQEVVHDLSNAMAEVDRAYSVAQTAFNRRIAAREEVASTRAAFEADKVPLDLFLEAQRRQADAESGFFEALVEYALAIKNVHFNKGSLLDYNEIYLSEGPWPDKAYSDAARIKERKHELLDYRMKSPPVSLGPIPQPAGERPEYDGTQCPVEELPPAGAGQVITQRNAARGSAVPKQLPGPLPQSPPPKQGPTTLPPSIPPAVAPPAASSQVAPRPLPSSASNSPPASGQQPDLEPHNEQLTHPIVQAAPAQRINISELLASQPPPAGIPTSATEPAMPAPSSADSHATQFPTGSEHTDSDNKPSTSTPADNSSAFTSKPTAPSDRAEETSTLSIYSGSGARSATHVGNSPASGDSQIRIVSDAEPEGHSSKAGDTSAPKDAAPITPAPYENANHSKPVPQASWPESTIQPMPPINQNDGPSQAPAATDGGSIWARGGVRPVSYPAAETSAPMQQFQPLPPMSGAAAQLPSPALPSTTRAEDAPMASASVSDAASHVSPGQTTAGDLVPGPAPLATTSSQQPAIGGTQTSTPNIDGPSIVPNSPVPQPNSIEPLPPLGR